MVTSRIRWDTGPKMLFTACVKRKNCKTQNIYHTRPYKSHHDSEAVYKKLSWKTKLDNNCDHLAYSIWQCLECLSLKSVPNLFPAGHDSSLEINVNGLTSHTTTTIKETNVWPECIQYIMNKLKWQSTTILYSIDLEACSTTVSLYPKVNALPTWNWNMA